MVYEFENTTRDIIGAFYEVYNHLGPGFLEKVYENAMLIELKIRGLQVNAQHPIKVKYKAHSVGEYLADLWVEGKVICEIKAMQSLRPEHEAQLINYLKATGIKVGLLLNFGPKPEIMRRVY
ncbi:MAG: GxxExxY protein [Desulfobacterales bacterium]|nr:GxxExxY protein [Desulfobacterales bacterium]